MPRWRPYLSLNGAPTYTSFAILLESRWRSYLGLISTPTYTSVALLLSPRWSSYLGLEGDRNSLWGLAS